ncbi:MAG TPA: YetF domain-containing protein [Planctomycetaceae bacterium]|nr:YetF domain-containing protein [Planctomycetaceae bacterium]
MYLALFALLRLFRRQAGSLGPADLLVLLLIADAAQNGMAGDYRSITDGLILVCTIVAWEYTLDWLGFRSRWMQQLLERSPLLLIKDGQVQDQHLSQELMTLDDLLANLRRKGVESPRQVKRCFLEGDGHVSVILFEPNSPALQDEETQQT